MNTKNEIKNILTEMKRRGICNVLALRGDAPMDNPNWTPGKNETYAIVEALCKLAGDIGFTPVIATTDHRALQHRVTEHVDTPPGSRRRPYLLHKTLSQFDLDVVYVPGPTKLVTDALSREA